MVMHSSISYLFNLQLVFEQISHECYHDNWISEAPHFHKMLELP